VWWLVWGCTPNFRPAARPLPAAPPPGGGGYCTHTRDNITMQIICCANWGVEEGEAVSIKACNSCMIVKYCNCNPTCQQNHWPKPMHKKWCKQCAGEFHDEALFKDPPAKEDCPICFIPMPVQLLCCASLPPTTILSVPIKDLANVGFGIQISTFTHDYIVRKSQHTNRRSCVWT
jgi:hypothetical protein